MKRARLLVLVALAEAACGSSAEAPIPDAAIPDAQVDKSGTCTDTFGSELTSAFGRLDGTVLAIVRPVDQQCPRPNSDHVILEVTMHGAAYRMVVNVQSDVAGEDPRVKMNVIDHALPGAAWSEGWHAGEPLDYVTTLGVHSDAFVPEEIGALADDISAMIDLGDHVSVYATSGGPPSNADSAHLVHRNAANQDGAIVLHADGAHPKILLFSFDSQTF
jgi:hypothetical protein